MLFRSDTIEFKLDLITILNISIIIKLIYFTLLCTIKVKHKDLEVSQ